MRLIKNIKKIIMDCLPHFIYRKVEGIKIRENKAESALKNKSTENFGIYLQKDEDCVILGNGPSLKDTFANEEKLKFIKARKKFCVNEFPLSNYFYDLRPEYLLFMDPFYRSKDTAEPYSSYYKQINHILSKVDWKIKVFMPDLAQEWNWFLDVPEKNPNIEIVYINIKPSQLKKDEDRFAQYKQNYAVPEIHNVLISGLYLAINAGFKNTYLFGADHSWHESMHIREDNVLCYKDRHFYDKEEVTTYTPIYKTPDCTQTYTIAELLGAFSNKYKSYEELEKYAKYMGTKIYNSSEVSYIDAFERKKNELGTK